MIFFTNCYCKLYESEESIDSREISVIESGDIGISEIELLDKSEILFFLNLVKIKEIIDKINGLIVNNK